MRYALAALSLASVTLLAACAPTPTLPLDDVPPGSDSPDGADTGHLVCTPGAQVACACVGGGAGAQVCSNDGTSLGTCMCPDGGVTVDVADVADAGIDALADIADTGADTADAPTETGIDGGVDGGADANDAPALVDVADAADVSIDLPTDSLADVRSDVLVDVCPGGASLLTDPNNCGACGHICPAADSAAPRCAAGLCEIACMRDYANCDGTASNGCEVNVYSDGNCGACGRRCEPAHGVGHCARAPSSVDPYRCAIESCASGYSDCDGNGFNGCEANRATDPMNCGTCSNPCTFFPHSVPTCTAGTCVLGTCETGYGNCDGMISNGCETMLTSPTNCGACGTRCGGLCVGGRCA